MAFSNWFLFLACVVAVQSYPRNKFFDYGAEFGDKILPAGDTKQTSLGLQTPLIYYNERHYYLYVNTDGVLTFNPVAPDSLPYQLGTPIADSQTKLIAPFLTDLTTTDSGTIYARHSSDILYLDTASRYITTFFKAPDFRATGVSIVTWEDVPINLAINQPANKPVKNITFQAILPSDGVKSFAIFLYDDNNEFPDPGTVQYLPFIGFASGLDQNRRWKWVTLGGETDREIYDATRASNVFQSGVMAFQIESRNPTGPNYGEEEGSGGGTNGAGGGGGGGGGGAGGGTDNTGGQDNTGDQTPGGGGTTDIGIEVPPGNPYDLDECTSCAFNSTCTEYTNGYCCVCNPGNYGNGRTCIDTNNPQRLNGEVSGNINGLLISSANLHAYVNTNEGLTYTAISPLPDRISYSLQSLSPVGELIGWMFALPSGKAINGFTQTGGVFTSTMIFNFETGEQLTINNEFLGVDADGYIRSRMTIDGNVPDIPAGIKLAVDDHKDVYQRRRNGLVHSYSERTLKFNDGSNREIRYTVDNTIEFDECTQDDADQDPRLNSMRVSFASIYLVYEPNESILRFRQQSKVVQEDEPQPDPCQNNNCDPNAQCLAQGNTFRCKCNNGFTGNGYVCRASDPCRNNNCDINAYCYPVETGFECVCNDGYAGDGYTCRVEDPCIDNQCDANASCYPQDVGYLCQCNSGFEGNGYYCQVSQSTSSPIDPTTLPPVDNCAQNQCDLNAYCTPIETSYRCTCNIGYQGNGFICLEVDVDPCANNQCHADAVCRPQGDIYTCLCRPGFDGNGYDCRPIEVDPCANNQCHADAVCRPQGDIYTCLCRPGFDGNGYDCRPEVDPCTNNECDPNAYCTPVRAGYVCTCNQFYQGDGYTCTRETVNRCENCHSNAQCIPLANGFRCVCNPGYEGDGRSCNDIDECTQGGAVACHPDAECYNTLGSYTCYCSQGFIGDGRTCTAIPQPQPSDAFLMFAQGMNLMRMPLDPNEKGGKIIMRARQTMVGVSYDCQDEYAYWTDVSSRTINRAKYDGSNYQLLVYSGLSSPEGIAVDHLSRNMYWTDSGFDRIEVSKLDGSNRKLLFDTDLVNPRGIAVDPIGGMLYWTDWNRANPKIEKSWLDGSNREVMIDTNVGLPNGITIDYASQQICWSDAGTKKIECMNMNGNTATRYTVFPAPEYPFGLTSYDYNLYWTDWDSRNIQTINKNGGLTSESLQLPKGGNGRVYGVTAVTSCPGGSNACSSSNGGCSSLCLPTPGNQRTCACPTASDDNEVPCVP